MDRVNFHFIPSESIEEQAGIIDAMPQMQSIERCLWLEILYYTNTDAH